MINRSTAKWFQDQASIYYRLAWIDIDLGSYASAAVCRDLAANNARLARQMMEVE